MCFYFTKGTIEPPKPLIAEEDIIVFKYTFQVIGFDFENHKYYSVNDCFISAFYEYLYERDKAQPHIELEVEKSTRIELGIKKDKVYDDDLFYVTKGYHSYIEPSHGDIRDSAFGVFKIPKGASYFINEDYNEIVSSDITYLMLLPEWKNEKK